ncbi:MAG: hypothetical protein P8Y45_07270 [Exilibacterium sp.]
MEALTDTNNLYLDASLRWLRLRLQQLILQSTMATPLEVIEQSAEDSAQTDANLGMWASIRRCLFGKGQHPAESRDDIENDEPSAHEKRRQAQKLEEDIRQTQAEMRELEDCERIPALLFLTQRFSLSDFERDTLLLCVAMELDPGLATLCAQAQGSASRNYPTFALALSLFDNPRWDSLAPQRPLRFARMIEINQPPAVPLTAATLKADERSNCFYAYKMQRNNNRYPLPNAWAATLAVSWLWPKRFPRNCSGNCFAYMSTHCQPISVRLKPLLGFGNVKTCCFQWRCILKQRSPTEPTHWWLVNTF